MSYLLSDLFLGFSFRVAATAACQIHLFLSLLLVVNRLMYVVSRWPGQENNPFPGIAT